VTIGDAGGTEPQAMVDYFARHGIPAAACNPAPIAGVGRGNQLLTIMREEQADLLVMGAYNHTPWREALLGGATQEALETSLVPVLLSH
jgi:nucleotide-binding universal stress UspA family protein